MAVIIENEQHDTLRARVLQLLMSIHPIDGPPVTVRADPAPSFQALVDDPYLKEHNITLNLSHHKNKNKNPVAECAIQEPQGELLHHDPTGDPVSLLSLTTTVNCLNSRIHFQGLSAHEMWTQREQFTNLQIPLSDKKLISTQHQQRKSNHLSRALSKAPTRHAPPNPSINVGDIDYLHADLCKNRARDRYLVLSVEREWCYLWKFAGTQLRSAIYPVKVSECVLVPANTNLHPVCLKYNSEHIESEDKEPTTFSHNPLHLQSNRVHFQHLTPVQALPPFPHEISAPIMTVNDSDDT